MDNIHQLNEEFDIFLHKLNQIKNPFEQSLFILIFIPYFQIFLDINKRTSRMICNIPLLRNNL
ncbi:Fic family protein [Candidatus Venteria ishoeyi]|uniref:Fic family protein n=1 Tax=Candidatus Venteria ishoeyi TaxID=1899563 RepID=UPI00387E2A06